MQHKGYYQTMKEETDFLARTSIILAEDLFEYLNETGLDAPTTMASCIIALFDISRKAKVQVEAMDQLLEKSKKSYRDILELVEEIQKETQNAKELP